MDKKDIQNVVEHSETVIVFIGTNDLINSNGGDLKGLNARRIEKGQTKYNDRLDDILIQIRQYNNGTI